MLLFSLLACTAADAPSGFDSSWSLVWEDEFDGPAGAPLDPSRWTHDIGGDGWGNDQLEHNTDRTDNVRLSGDGALEIVALREEYDGNSFTSGRIKTVGLFEQGYGRFEASIKLPEGQGLWPAFWMLGADFEDVGWPLCGEVDIMEFRGENPTESLGTIHGPGYSGGGSVGRLYALSEGSFSEDYHTFAVEIDPGSIAWYIDDERFFSVSRASLPDEGAWVFDDNRFFLLLNLAVGGSFLAEPTDDTPFPATMSVEHVRAYARADGYFE